MSGRIFQGVVLQMKENTDRTIGVMDGEGVVVACSELTLIGQRWAEYVNPINNAAGALLCLEAGRSPAGAPSSMRPSLWGTIRSAGRSAPQPPWRERRQGLARGEA